MSSSTAEEELTLEAIRSKYLNRWVAIEVTKRDSSQQPAAGVVVADDVDRYRLRQKLTRYADICILYAGDSSYTVMM
ncbi:MAG TPA: hypothetical protein VMS77_00845 [Conexivisphaerales archaeon]|nr:hypothetical protein [Conexivisphaerales archaeon]